MKWKNIQALILKDFRSELKDKYAIGAILLFVITTTYIIYKAFQSMTVMSWNVLFWIIFLFAGLNALIRSFNNESHKQFLYYYQLVHPGEIIIAKIIYNIVMLLTVSMALYGALALFTINPVQDLGLFLLTISLGSIGVSVCFTFVAAILGTNSNQSTMMAILALPLIIPILLLVIKLSGNALGILSDTNLMTDIILLGGIDSIIFGLAVMIYPVLWRS